MRDPRPQARELDHELLRAFRRRRLERERPEPLPNLRLDVAGALDLDGDTRELELGAVTAGLEAAEAGSLLDQRTPLGRPRREDRLDLALADDRVHSLAEPEVGEQLDEVEPPHGSPVDEVLPLAAAVQATGHRELGIVDGQRPVGVVEEELDLAEVGGAARAAAGEEDVVGLLGPQLGRAEGTGGPADRVGDVRLAGAVRADNHADARLETDLDRVGERLEAAQLDRPEVHEPRTLSRAADAASACYASSAIARRSSREILPTSSGWSRLTCSSALASSSSSVSPRTTRPHSQLISLAIVLLLR